MEKILEWLNSLFYPDELHPYKESLPYLLQDNGILKGKSTHEGEILTIVQKPNSQQIRAALYNTMVIKPVVKDESGRVIITDVIGKIDSITNIMIANKARYETVAHKFPNPIKWYHIALIHRLEGNSNFNTYLGNGQSLYRKTTIVPKGRGPFKTFEEGAIDAIKLDKLDLVQDWSIGNTLEMLERFNGWGYVLYHPDVNSPYLWSGTDKYSRGKYTEDGKFDRNKISDQIGIAPIMKVLMEKINYLHE